MYIAETFYSVQGEGKYIGVPSFFIRSSGCNLRCEWRDQESGEVTKCDTPYTSWAPNGTIKSIDDLVRDVQRVPAQHVVITGGEPFMQKDLPKLAAELARLGYHITVETNGTLFKELPPEVYLSISPKMSNSVPYDTEYEKVHSNRMRNPETLRKFTARHDYQFKFVVVVPDDLREIQGLQSQLLIPSSKIYLMPEGNNSKAIRDRSLWIIELCKRYGFNFSDRLHIHLWRNEKGF